MYREKFKSCHSRKANLAIIYLPLLLSIFILLGKYAPALAKEKPIIKAVLFYKPDCKECREIITKVIPALKRQYGDQMQVLAVNNAQPQGGNLYLNTLIKMTIPLKQKLPTLISGEEYFGGSAAISDKFHLFLKKKLAEGGTDWPPIPGLLEILSAVQRKPDTNLYMMIESSGRGWLSGIRADFGYKFNKDPVGNTFSVIVLAGMILSLLGCAFLFVCKSSSQMIRWPRWPIPVLSLVGLVAAGYLSYVKITGSQVVCGPVGNCGAVQESSFAILLGIIPISMLGFAVCLSILAIWTMQYYGPLRWRDQAALILFATTFLSVSFFAYLTFLEPFIIGATCAWCLTAGVAMTLQLWAAAIPARNSWKKLSN